jgi:hypothetical protein
LFLLTIPYVIVSIGLLVATRQQAKLTREALATDKRAFMSPEGFRQFWEVAPEGRYNWRFRVHWRNTGSTPTKEATMYSQCEIRDSLLPPGYNFPVDDRFVVKMFVGPNTDAFGGSVPRSPEPAITPDDVADVQEGRKIIYLWGWIKYNDVFPSTPQHISHFCWALTITGNPRTFVPNTPGMPPMPGVLLFQNLLHQEGNYAD